MKRSSRGPSVFGLALAAEQTGGRCCCGCVVLLVEVEVVEELVDDVDVLVDGEVLDELVDEVVEELELVDGVEVELVVGSAVDVLEEEDVEEDVELLDVELVGAFVLDVEGELDDVVDDDDVVEDDVDVELELVVVEPEPGVAVAWIELAPSPPAFWPTENVDATT
jgi:hypothetical protein